jgi:hypothetical protein
MHKNMVNVAINSNGEILQRTKLEASEYLWPNASKYNVHIEQIGWRYSSKLFEGIERSTGVGSDARKPLDDRTKQPTSVLYRANRAGYRGAGNI